MLVTIMQCSNSSNSFAHRLNRQSVHPSSLSSSAPGTGTQASSSPPHSRTSGFRGRNPKHCARRLALTDPLVLPMRRSNRLLTRLRAVSGARAPSPPAGTAWLLCAALLLSCVESSHGAVTTLGEEQGQAGLSATGYRREETVRMGGWSFTGCQL